MAYKKSERRRVFETLDDSIFPELERLFAVAKDEGMLVSFDLLSRLCLRMALA